MRFDLFSAANSAKYAFGILLLFCFTKETNALNPTPIRLSLITKAGLEAPCYRARTKTYGLDLGIWSSACEVMGLQVGAGTGSGKLYGVQVGAVSVAEAGYGIQFGGLFAYSRHFRGIQISPLANNFAIVDMQYWPTTVGIQAAVLLNMSGYPHGIQLALLNGAYKLHGVQLGGINGAEDVNGIQIGFYNGMKKMNGIQAGIINAQRSLARNIGDIDPEGTFFQIGIVNYANRIAGTQLGIVNIAKQIRGLQIGLINIIPKTAAKHRLTPLPFTPILNAAW